MGLVVAVGIYEALDLVCLGIAIEVYEMLGLVGLVVAVGIFGALDLLCLGVAVL